MLDLPNDTRQPEKDTEAPHAIALSIAGLMKGFGSGEMAALRRLGSDAAAPAYWRLAARHPKLETRSEVWTPIVQALALLMPKGPPEERGDLHDPHRPLGRALCDGGRHDWPAEAAQGAPRPVFSEQRLAQLLAARGSQRRILLLRAVRMLAASRDADLGLDVGDLAWRFTDPDTQRLAAPYYHRLDRAERAAKATTDNQGPGDD